MAFDFPTTPSAGQEYTPAGGPTYVYQAPRWVPKTYPALATISDAAPAGPLHGQLWWQSSSGSLFIYYNDGTSSQWVQINVGADI